MRRRIYRRKSRRRRMRRRKGMGYAMLIVQSTETSSFLSRSPSLLSFTSFSSTRTHSQHDRSLFLACTCHILLQLLLSQLILLHLLHLLLLQHYLLLLSLLLFLLLAILLLLGWDQSGTAARVEVVGTKGTVITPPNRCPST